ncbi:MAG: IclR family transcriptional regulator C-terminal domain-containing protein [Pseudomonas sp.]|uniref:IclR family transcriptional regulator domain-containing protein n=1 Tax=Pseudomonas abieticivorans TaxID=2931382 RepID=UPI0020BD8412|nr:IclR family transcriptional regulator C-terminal domain-containing protein [Pseudomonas sp. PIA16]MDE1169523.1 IclR family transcriptional regulator C-terminal domain-containing protein [Pseudomonas sp.]
MKTPSDGTGALEKAMDVLEAIGSRPEGVSQAELAVQMGLPRTTLYRIIASLIDRGMIRRDPVRKVYRLGFRYLELVRNAYLMPDLVAAASFELRALRDLTGETSYLAVLDGNQVMSLERCDGAHTQRSAAAMGQSKPVYCTGQGKAILAALDEARREEVLKGLTLAALTPLTITDRRQLQAELKITRARGYAIDDEEIVLGVRCVAAAIRDNAGKVRGALSVAGPAYRLTLNRLELLGPELADAARRVGSQLSESQVRLTDSEAQLVPGPWSFHGAFARWCDATQRLFWADTLAPAIRVLDAQGERIVARFDGPICALELHRDGLMVGHASGWSLIDASGLEHPLAHWPGKRLLSLAVHPCGSLWACLATPTGCEIGELDVQGELLEPRAFQEPVSAFGWDAKGESLYAVGPDSGSIFVLRGQGGGVRRLATLPKGSGRLSGLALDSQGGVWTTLRDGWSLVRFAADGSLDRMIGLPVPSPTDLAFCGPSNDTLYITTSRHDLAMEALGNAPASGHLLHVNPELSGVGAARTHWGARRPGSST